METNKIFIDSKSDNFNMSAIIEDNKLLNVKRSSTNAGGKVNNKGDYIILELQNDEELKIEPSYSSKLENVKYIELICVFIVIKE
jgi:hypothetical protein